MYFSGPTEHHFGNLPAPEADQVFMQDNPPLYTSNVFTPSGTDNTVLWVFVAIVALVFLSGNKKGGQPLANPPFPSRKHPQHVKGYYAHAYYRKKRK